MCPDIGEPDSKHCAVLHQIQCSTLGAVHSLNVIEQIKDNVLLVKIRFETSGDITELNISQ